MLLRASGGNRFVSHMPLGVAAARGSLCNVDFVSNDRDRGGNMSGSEPMVVRVLHGHDND